jgi:spectinomycin phosphotransferase
MKGVLKENYAIDALTIEPVTGGWSSLAYRVETANRSYFLKAYELWRDSTAFNIKNINTYVPLLMKLNRNPVLKNRLVEVIPTLTGEFSCRGENCVYMLHPYIDGITPKETPLKTDQVIELAHIMGALHKCGEISLSLKSIKEDFTLPFLKPLSHWITENPVKAEINESIQTILSPRKKKLEWAIKQIEGLASAAADRRAPYVLCHTDIHGWNLMITREGLRLIDFEGMLLAPAEADIFALISNDWWPDFLEIYCKYHPGYEPDSLLLEFYGLRRILVDIYEELQLLDNRTVVNERDLDGLKESLESLG